jgi:serine/threonine protein kinase
MDETNPTVILQSGQEEPPSPIATYRLLTEVETGEIGLGTEKTVNTAARPLNLDRELAEMGVTMPSLDFCEDGHPPVEEEVKCEEERRREVDEAIRIATLRDLAKEYKFGQVIGRGGQGEILEARQLHLGRTVAVKRAGTDPEAQRDFFKEAFTSAQLDHPNIIPVHELGIITERGLARPILAMKRVEGVSWSSMLKSDRKLRESDPQTYLSRHLSILSQMINAVAYAHSKGIIHRDLKPSQVMVGNYGEVFLLDWGLAVYVGEQAPSTSQSSSGETRVDTKRLFTRETATCPAGTPAYMAPEQAVSDPAVLGLHTDIYLIGSILYELLTGLPPHAEKTVQAAVESAKRNIVKPIPMSAPEELRLLTERCLERKAIDRPVTALEVKKLIEDYLSGSGRKAESLRLTQEVGEVWRLTDYTQLSSASRMISQAAHLWPDNPNVEELKEQLLCQFVEAALQRGDFLLANVQANRIKDRDVAAAYLSVIDVRREEALKQLPRSPLLTPERLGILVGMWGLILATVAATLFVAHNTLLDEVHDKVRSVASLAARDVQAEDLRAVDRRPDVLSPEFQRVLNRLNIYRRSNEDIRYIYTMRPNLQVDPNSWRVLVDADPADIDMDGDGTIGPDEEGNPPGSLYDDGNPEMLVAFNERRATSGLLVDSWGSFISGFAPVIDEQTGEVVAIVGVDIRRDVALGKLRLVYVAGVLGGLVVLLLTTLALIAWFKSRRALRIVELLEEQLRKQSRELGERDLHLG